MTTHDPIADHVNLLLQQYFSTQTPNADTSDQGVPMITYDDENNSIVMEYLSPDGSTSSFTKPHNNEHSEPEQEAGQAVPNFFPQPDNTDTALLPILNSSSKSAMEVLDRVFEPSKTPGMRFLQPFFIDITEKTYGNPVNPCKHLQCRRVPVDETIYILLTLDFRVEV